jgi:aspartyl-tRNA(Asn)/glutamyl-tRNA(Gln) amidotransferase subunit A
VKTPVELSAIELRDRIAGGDLSCVDAARAALDRLHAVEPRLHAFLDVLADRALDRARALDARRARSEPLGRLGGVPVALKDNICLSERDGGERTTAGSKFLERYRSPFTATSARRMLDEGAIVVGKTNLDEFAMGSSGENSAFGPTGNPWDPTRVPGGSSSGSAAAVAGGVVPLALGSDTGGSIRQPAGMTNLVALKPTYGRVSRWGLIAYASSLDQIGAMTRTVADCALASEVICGPDPLDSTCLDRPAPDLLSGLETPIARLVLGVPVQARSDANHPGVTAALERAIRTFRDLGATVVDIDLPHIDAGIAAYYIIATAEASSNLARFDGVRYGRRTDARAGDDLAALYARSRAEGFGPEVRRRILLGTHVLSAGYADAYYLTALKARRLIKRDYDEAFSGRAGRGDGVSGCHAVLLPTAPTPAFKLGEKSSDPLSMYLGDVYTVGVNLAGLPALAFPGGFAEAGSARLPVGLQLVGPALEEGLLLRIARMYEAAGGFCAEIPPAP